MKLSLLLATLLLLASSAQAQHHHQTPVTENPQGFLNNGWGGGGYGEIGSTARHVRYEPPRNFEVGYARNDGPFVPSTYMKYEDALALGKQQLAAAQRAAEGDTGPSLGEIARSYRVTRVPTLKLQARVIQDDAGKLEICNLNGNNCHRP
ncbi:MAG: hypothetical protein WBR10_10485 [Candidatus Acidiferrum sp.]